MKLWWRVSYPIYVVSEENLAELQATFTIGSFGNTYQEPMYQLSRTVENEEEAIRCLDNDLNVTLRRGHNGPVIYKRHDRDIFREDDKPFQVDETTFLVTQGNYHDHLECVYKIGDTLRRVTYSDGSRLLSVV